MKKIILSILLTTIINLCFSQTFYKEIRYNGYYFSISSFIITEGDTIIATGSVIDSLNIGVIKPIFIKLDKNINIIKADLLCADSTKRCVINENNLIKTQNGYAACGFTGDSVGVLLVINNNGNYILKEFYSDSCDNFFPKKIIQLPDHSFIISGIKYLDFLELPISNNKIFLLKTDSLGNFIWKREFAIPLPLSAMSRKSFNPHGLAHKGDTIIIGCNVNIDIYTEREDQYTYLMYTDTSGNIISSFVSDNDGYSVFNIIPHDSGMIFIGGRKAGIDDPCDCIYHKITVNNYVSDNNQIYCNSFDDIEFYNAFAINNTYDANNRRFLVSNINYLYWISDSLNTGEYKLKWGKQYNIDLIRDIETTNGDSILIAFSNNPGIYSIYYSKSYISKLSPDGNCDDMVVHDMYYSTPLYTKNFNIQIYPNPSNNYLNFSAQNQGIISIFSISGSKLSSIEYKTPQSNFAVDVSYLSTGMYFIEFSTKEKGKESVKFVKK